MFEACVTSVAHARRAVTAGAHRIELCARIGGGGLTPGARTVAGAIRLRIPVHVMIRPRAGAYRYTSAERQHMIHDVHRFRSMGAAAFVIGALTPDGVVDENAVAGLVSAAGERPVTFHRAFDEVPDMDAALETLVRLGVRRLLTSGGAPTAWDGRERLASLVARARGRIGIIAAGSVRAAHVRALIGATGVREVHAHVDGEALEALGRALAE